MTTTLMNTFTHDCTISSHSRRAVMRSALHGFLFVFISLLGWNQTGAAAESIETLTTAEGVRFGLWPRKPAQPAPTMFVLANTIEGTLNSPHFRAAGDLLAKDGWLLVSVDLPSHGAEVRPDEGSGLVAWRARCVRDDNFVAELTGRLTKVLDYLIREKLADPERIATLGTSRGGYSAIQFAAADVRVKCVAGFAPLTDLAMITEFQGAEELPLVKRLALDHCAEALAGRPLWIVIGDRDTRVNTDAVIRFARRATAAALEKNLPARVDLHVVAEPRGHAVPASSAAQAAEWFRAQFADKPSP